MRISDWSSDVCSSDLAEYRIAPFPNVQATALGTFSGEDRKDTVLRRLPPSRPTPSPRAPSRQALRSSLTRRHTEGRSHEHPHAADRRYPPACGKSYGVLPFQPCRMSRRGSEGLGYGAQWVCTRKLRV